MEVKSRYEVISELEKQKRNYIEQEGQFDALLLAKQKEIKQYRRALEDKEEALAEFENSLPQQRETLKVLIAAVDASLERMNSLSKG